MLQISLVMEDRKWNYLLPDGFIATDMKTARIKMGLGAQGFRALVRKGIVKKIQTKSKTPGYEYRKQNS